MRTLDQQVEMVRAAGYRLTRSRLAVLSALAEADGLMDVSDIHQIGRRTHPRLGRVSVYRTLDLLAELGLARKVHRADGCHSYARADRSEGHYLICRHCGQVQEFPCEGLEPLVESLGRRYGFAIQQHLLQLEGLCSGCRPASQAGRV